MPHFPRRAALLAAVLLPGIASAAPLSLEQAQALARQASAAVRAAQAGELSAAEAARAAGQLPDPVLSAGIDNLPITGRDRLSTAADSMTMKRVGLNQEWLPADKRAAQRAAAQALAEREAGLAHTAIADTRLQVALAYVDAYYATQASALAAQAEHHGREELAAARARLATASGSGAEALAMESALGLAQDDMAEARQAQRQAGLLLQRWTGLPTDELEPPLLPTAAEQAAFVARHPAVAAARRDVEVARQDASLARANRRPNWTWGISYGQRPGNPDMLSFGVSIPIPVAPAQRQDREAAARLALVDKAEAALAEAERAATAEYLALADEAGRLAERLARYGTAVLEPAAQRTAAALAGYRANQNALSALFEARHAETTARRRQVSLQRDLARVQAQLVFKPLAEGDAP
ncbi:MAG TPA: TolC family protein [Roseateles sp.]